MIALSLVVCTRALADDWPNWRGPNRDGISIEKGWRDQWPREGPAILWKASVGTGFSSFVVAKGRVYTTGNADEKDTIFCLDAATGKEVWKYSYPAELGDKFFEGGTTGTPTVSDDRVFLLSRWGDVFCFDAASGSVVWNRNLQRDSGVRVPGWGFSGSPVVHENLLLLNAGAAGMALEKATGKTVWKSADEEAGYCTPLPVKSGDRWIILLSSEKAYLAVELLTGKEVWRQRWLTQYGLNAADPIPEGDRVFISSGYGKGAVLLRPNSGTEPEIVWRSQVLRTQMNPAVRVGEFLYGVDGDSTDKPALKCIELATGRERWAESSAGVRSVMVADGKLIAQTERGEVIVAPASSEGFKASARAQILGGKCWTVPVLANGRLYCRNSRGDVVCADLRK
jgi:outer membrane protein assembly factor BamB